MLRSTSSKWSRRTTGAHTRCWCKTTSMPAARSVRRTPSGGPSPDELRRLNNDGLDIGRSCGDTLRDRVARALVWTTDQIESGRGKSQIRIMDMYLGDIQKHLGRRIPNEMPRYALRVECVEDDPGGPEVAVDKTRSGIFVIMANVFVVSHDMSWARTLTNGFELDGCRAEPVTCSIKGRRSAGFRVTGRVRSLFAFDPAIAGRDGIQERIRDRIVSTFNGEEQAGPGQRDTSGSVQTAVLRLVSVPGTSSDVRNPPLDGEGRLVLAPGESILYRRSCCFHG